MIRTADDARAWRAHLNSVAADLGDAAALDAVALYPAWLPDRGYTAGQRLRHNAQLYRCVQAHTSQAGWEPDVTPALWARISVDEWPAWVQPTGVQDAYMTGDKVTFEGKHYISQINNNTWSPAAHPAGWQEVT